MTLQAELVSQLRLWNGEGDAQAVCHWRLARQCRSVSIRKRIAEDFRGVRRFDSQQSKRPPATYAPLFAILGLVVLFAGGCGGYQRTSQPRQDAPVSHDVPVAPTLAEDSVPTAAGTSSASLKPDWVFVEKKADPSKDGWVTGTFDSQHNKLTIKARNVARFAIDTSRVPIDWNRLVILRLNGRNSELRNRDQVFYRFAKDKSRGWVVVDR